MNQSMKDGEVSTYEEIIMDGPKGITVKLFNKDKNSVEKIVISGKDDKFTMRTMDGDKKDEKSLNRDELMNELKKNKKLKFAADFVKTQKGGDWLDLARSVKGTKRGSKRGSKKGSKSTTVSKPKRGTKRGSKKGSKKTSKRGSK
jgi:hypothetical protein